MSLDRKTPPKVIGEKPQKTEDPEADDIDEGTEFMWPGALDDLFDETNPEKTSPTRRKG